MIRSLTTLLLLANLTPVDLPVVSNESFASQADLIDVQPIPHLQKNRVAPQIEAKAALLVDNATGLVLYEKNPQQPLPMASLTKIMTAILILEHHELDEVVTVSSNYSDLEGVKINVHQGEQMTVDSLLKALLLPSAGDAAMALAEYHSGSVAAFVEEMNQRAKALNLTHTYFKNPVGLDEEGHLSTAGDLVQLARYAMHFPAFRSIVKQSNTTIESIDGHFSYGLTNTNHLLGSYLNVLGIKTGTTDEAGESLINLARNDQGHEVLSVLLNSPDRFQESKSMLDWAFRSYLW